MNRALIIGILGGVIVVAAVVLTFFIDRPPDGADEAKTAPPVVQPQAPKTAEVKAEPEAPAPVVAAEPQDPAPKDPEKAIKPSFDVVRINPRGDTVIAGRAKPHAEVTIKDGEKVIGKVTADARGEWVQVPEKALPPGTRELSLSAKSKEQKEPVKSENKVVLVVPERGKDIAGRETPSESGALVIAVPSDGSPGVKVLQTPGASVEVKEQEPAAIASQDGPAGQPGRDEPARPAGQEPGTAVAVAPSEHVTPKIGQPDDRPAKAPPSAKPAPKAAPGEFVVATVQDQAATTTPPAAEQTAKPGETRGVKLSSNGATAEPEIGLSASSLTLDAIDYDDTGRLALTGRAKAGASVQIYLDNKPLGAASADQSGRWQLEPSKRVPPGLYRMRVDQIDPKGRVLARIETPFSRAEPLGDLPRDSIVFVQPGNSLWRIARRTYGEGLRYSVIYEANREQIRNPDLIYPGQVFQLPRVN